MSNTGPDRDAEDLIASLAGGLAPADREPFRRAAEVTLALSPQCLGGGSIYRALVPVWREFELQWHGVKQRRGVIRLVRSATTS